MVDPLTFLAALAAFGVFADKLADLLEKLRAEKLRRNRSGQYLDFRCMTRVVKAAANQFQDR